MGRGGGEAERNEGVQGVKFNCTNSANRFIKVKH